MSTLNPGPEVPDKHRAGDQFAANAVHAAQRITEALRDAGVPEDGAVVVRRDGPHRSIADVERLLDEALDEEASPPIGHGR